MPHEKTQKYIHKYDTHSSPECVFSTAQIQYQALQETNVGALQCINRVIHPTIGTACSYRKLVTGTVPKKSTQMWVTALTNEFGRLVDGIGSRIPIGTNVIKFISREQVPRRRKVTYVNMVCDIRP